ncbi:MmgE/PrpD family protein [Escherichia coli]
MEALEYPACKKLLGQSFLAPSYPTACASPELSSSSTVQAAFNIGAMIRWLDFNNTWLAAEVGPSFRQPRRHSGNGGLAFAQRGRQRQSAVDHETGADRNDQSP